MKYLFLISFIILSISVKAQCPYISGVLAHADASGLPAGEGKNEFVAFNTGTSSVAANAVFISYGTNTTSTNFSINGVPTSPSVWTSLVTPTLITNSSGSITVVSSTGSIPANKNVVVIASTNTIAYDLKTFGTDVYVLPYNSAAGSPRVVAYAPLGNYGNSGGSARYLRISVGACRDTVSYIPSSLPGSDGGGAKWNSAGTITYYNTGATGVVLPVNLISVDGYINNGTSVLEWSTSGNSSAIYFEIEKSVNGAPYKKVGSVQASTNNTIAVKKYSFTENNLDANFVLYRIRLMDIDGSETYSPSVRLSQNTSLSSTKIFPNPVKNELNIENKLADFSLFTIIDYLGRPVLSQNLLDGKNTFDVSFLPLGLYIVQLTGNSEKVIQKFIKQ